MRFRCLSTMTDRDPLGFIDPRSARNISEPPTQRLHERERSFGTPLLFDLTVLQEDPEETQSVPTVYYLAAMVPSPRSTSHWRTLAGFSGVILAGVGLGLLLAVWLL